VIVLRSTHRRLLRKHEYLKTQWAELALQHKDMIDRYHNLMKLCLRLERLASTPRVVTTSALTREDCQRLIPVLESAVAEVDAAAAPDATMRPVDDGADLMAAYTWAQLLLKRLREALS
jgi:hypothetical protein